MIDPSIDVTISRLTAKISGLAPSDPEIAVALTRITSLLKAKIVGNIRNNPNFPKRFPKGEKSGLVDKSHLMGSIRTKVTTAGGKGRGTVASVGVFYAELHERGGKISAKSSFGLAVPFAPWAKDRTLKQVGKHIIVRKPSGNKFLGFAFVQNRMPKGKKRKGVNPFQVGAVSHLILRYVDIPKRPFFYPAIESSTTDIVDILRNMRRENGG